MTWMWGIDAALNTGFATQFNNTVLALRASHRLEIQLSSLCGGAKSGSPYIFLEILSELKEFFFVSRS